MKRLAAAVALVVLPTAILTACSPPTIGQLAIHRLGNGSLNAVIAGCKPGLQRVTAYVGEVNDSTPPAAEWTLRVDPNSRADQLLEWPLLGGDSSDVRAVRSLKQIPAKAEINLLAATPGNGAIATSIGLTPKALQRLRPDKYAFYGLDGGVLYGTPEQFLAGACP